jgi:hypothetical protein
MARCTAALHPVCLDLSTHVLVGCTLESACSRLHMLVTGSVTTLGITSCFTSSGCHWCPIAHRVLVLLLCLCACRVNMYSSFYVAVRGKKDS